MLSVKLTEKLDKSYPIFIEQNAANRIPAWLKKNKIGNKFCVITDSKVKRLYGNSFLRFLKKNGIECDIISFPDGEKSKNLKTIEKLAEEMVKKGFDRSNAIIALGGGVVGDMAGFLSSIYMRGINYIQIPTTLLAMVDSSIGGKTGVDLKSGKNLIGTFTQPKAVFVDPDYLDTLPIKQIRNGLAEVIKYGVIKDKKLFEFIEENSEKILNLNKKSLNKIIEQSLRIKKQIVEKDEKEQGIRIILNYGHSYGHAIEKMTNFKLLHGYAISIGMVLENKIAVEKDVLKPEDAKRIKDLLSKVGLPIVTLKKPTKNDLKSDKKKSGKYLNLVLPEKIGQARIEQIEL